jgi:hypothetical protein
MFGLRGLQPKVEPLDGSRLKEVLMPQDRGSGAAANEWGRDTARRIATKIGATMKSRASNEATYEGRRVVIKCAATKTNSVGVTYKMLPTLDCVIGAFQIDDGSFELWKLKPTDFSNAMRETRSRGTAAGKVGIVSRDAFQERGEFVTRIRLDKTV